MKIKVAIFTLLASSVTLRAGEQHEPEHREIMTLRYAQALDLLRMYCTHSNEILETKLSACRYGDQNAYNHLKSVIESNKKQSLLDVATIEKSVVDYKPIGIEARVSRLLPSEMHPCHSIVEYGDFSFGGYVKPTKVWPYAKHWIISGQLKKAVEARHQAAFEALKIIVPEEPKAKL